MTIIAQGIYSYVSVFNANSFLRLDGRHLFLWFFEKNCGSFLADFFSHSTGESSIPVLLSKTSKPTKIKSLDIAK
jgi:hypothetical protein